MPKLTLITPTGGRPEAFAMCERYMARQTLQDWEWIVVDDCNPTMECTMGQKVIHSDTFWVPGGPNTQNRNLLLALEQVNTEFVAVVEDDDWYGPKHLENLCNHLKSTVMAGELPSRYYNVKHQMFRIMTTGPHASLCQTGFRADLILTVKQICKANSDTDVLLWRQMRGLSPQLYPGNQVVGIKGMPGRAGAGIGHYPKLRPHYWINDPEAATLKQWIGEDAELYRSYYDGGRNAA